MKTKKKKGGKQKMELIKKQEKIKALNEFMEKIGIKEEDIELVPKRNPKEQKKEVDRSWITCYGFEVGSGSESLSEIEKVMYRVLSKFKKNLPNYIG